MEIKYIYKDPDYSKFNRQDEDFDTCITIESEKEISLDDLKKMHEEKESLIKEKEGVLDLIKIENGIYKLNILTPLNSFDDLGHRQVFPSIDNKFYTLN